MGALRKQREVSIKFPNTKSIPYNMPRGGSSIQNSEQNSVSKVRNRIGTGAALCSVVEAKRLFECKATALAPLVAPLLMTYREGDWAEEGDD